MSRWSCRNETSDSTCDDEGDYASPSQNGKGLGGCHETRRALFVAPANEAFRASSVVAAQLIHKFSRFQKSKAVHTFHRGSSEQQHIDPLFVYSGTFRRTKAELH